MGTSRSLPCRSRFGLHGGYAIPEPRVPTILLGRSLLRLCSSHRPSLCSGRRRDSLARAQGGSRQPGFKPRHYRARVESAKGYTMLAVILAVMEMLLEIIGLFWPGRWFDLPK